MILASVLAPLKQPLAYFAKLLVLGTTLLFVVSCSGSPPTDPSSVAVSESSNAAPFSRPSIKLVEAPALIQELKPWLEDRAPQVQIRQPQADQVLDTTTVDVMLQVQDLPIYKDETWGMGPHLALLLDNQPQEDIYDIEQPVVLEHLAPGTHTLRVLVEHPWHESFKNEGSYAQVTFHVFAKTDENAPTAKKPLLTYGSPVGTYGAEPVLLDFYLTDAPLHQVAQDNPALSDWRIRYTINGDSLTVRDWQPVYIEGLKQGQNWVQLTLVDDNDHPIKGVFNNTVRLIDYDPELNDSLAKIIRGELTLAEVGGILDPTYEPPAPVLPEASPPEMEIDPEEAPSNIDGDEGASFSNLEGVAPEVIETKAPKAIESETADSDATEEPTIQPAKVPLESPPVPSEKADEPDSTAEQTIEVENPLNTLSPAVQRQDSEETASTEMTSSDEDEGAENEGNMPIGEAEALPAVDDNAVDGDAPESTVPSPEAETTKVEEKTGSYETEEDTASPVPSPKRQYLQRLYDYRERSMETYGQNRD